MSLPREIDRENRLPARRSGCASRRQTSLEKFCGEGGGGEREATGKVKLDGSRTQTAKIRGFHGRCRGIRDPSRRYPRVGYYLLFWDKQRANEDLGICCCRGGQQKHTMSICLVAHTGEGDPRAPSSPRFEGPKKLRKSS